MLQAHNVTVRYKRGFNRGSILALDDFNLNINKGDITALLGPNGAGKSTAMYCFMGLIKPSSGSVTIFGEKPELGSPVFERIAYLPEEPHYHLYLTIYEALEFYSSLYIRDIDKNAIDMAIEQVGLSEYRDIKIENCSKGMKQKAGLASCLIHSPDMIFLDEPTRGLDPMIVKELRDILLDMNKKGTTMVINSHVLSEVEAICTRVAIINRGTVILDDEMKNLRKWDTENYTVRFSNTEDIPDFISSVNRSDNSIYGLIPKDEVQNFFAFAHRTGIQVYECSLKRSSLEAAFFNKISEKDG